MQVTPSARAVEQARSERVGEIVSALKAGDFDAARYESTPRRRAEVLAQVLTRALSRGAMRRRLKRLGFDSRSELAAISVEGGGLDVRLPNGEHVLKTGPKVNRDLLAVFPELLPHTLTALTVDVSGAPGDVTISISDPDTSGSNALVVDMSLYPANGLASGAVARYSVSQVTTGLPPATFNAGTISDPFGSSATPSGTYVNTVVTFAWSAAGVNWVEIFAAQPSASPGNKSQTLSIASGDDWGGLADFDWVTVTYTVPPCLTCEIVLEASHGCTGAALGGVTLTLNNGLSCTTNGAGECTIAGIPDGDYTYIIEKVGFVSRSGTFICECLEGGQTVISISLYPVGGCKPPPQDEPTDLRSMPVPFLAWYASLETRVGAHRRTDGDCDEHGGVSVGSECAETGGISTSEGGECDETGGISTDADGECDEEGGVTAT